MHSTSPFLCLAIPPGCTEQIAVLAGSVHGYAEAWMHLVRLAGEPTMRERWVHEILNKRDPVAFFTTLFFHPDALDSFIARGGNGIWAETLKACPLWMRIVGPMPTTAHGRMALLAKVPKGDALADFAAKGMPLLVKPSDMAKTGNSAQKNWPKTDALWRSALNLPDWETDRNERRAQLQAARGRVKGPRGGNPARRPPPTQPAPTTT